jgi:hypothetical protein
LARTNGESVQLSLNSSLGPNIWEIDWSWNSEGKNKQFLVSWKSDFHSPKWFEFEDKYKHRFNVTETFLLSITNLSKEMSGLYTAEIKFHSGKYQEEAFRLCVYGKYGSMPKKTFQQSNVTVVTFKIILLTFF